MVKKSRFKIVRLLLILVFISCALWSFYGTTRSLTANSLLHAERVTLQDQHSIGAKVSGENSSEEVSDTATPVALGPLEDEAYVRQWRLGLEVHNESFLTPSEVDLYVKTILEPAKNSTVWTLPCDALDAPRYESLQDIEDDDGGIRYLFALDLYQSTHVLPTLMASIVQSIRFLGPKRCSLSVVEGRSTDGTYEIVSALRSELTAMGATFYMSTSDIDPKEGTQDRIAGLAFLRNLALAPMMVEKAKYSSNALVVFLNDVYLCPHDILELILQHTVQNASMTCGMDWSNGGSIFYDIWVARSIVGETFWQIAQDGYWTFAHNLFWADRETKAKYEAQQPFPVYSCWNGGAVISAMPIMNRQIQFRRNDESTGECYMGEATLFSKDLWRLGLGRIQVVPTVNVGYENTTAEVLQDKRDDDRVDSTDGLNMTGNATEPLQRTDPVRWTNAPPSHIKCMVAFHDSYWVPST